MKSVHRLLFNGTFTIYKLIVEFSMTLTLTFVFYLVRYFFRLPIRVPWGFNLGVRNVSSTEYTSTVRLYIYIGHTNDPSETGKS